MGLLLVGFDGSDPSRRALDHAVARAKLSGDEIVLLLVVPKGVAQSSLSGMMPPGLELPPELDRTFVQNAKALVDEAVASHHGSGVKIQAVVKEGEAGRELVEAATRLKATEVIIGRKSYEAGHTKLGPVAERLVRNLPATVTVVR